MNEGKPAKAKWWNRPRPQEASGRADGTTPTPDESMPVTAPEDARDGDGDFELRPAGAGAGDAASADGDFELARPTVSGAGESRASADGDFALRPAAGGVGDTASDEGDFELARPAEVPASTAAAVEEPADRPTVPAASVAEHPKPLHDPDPYSTPPYGEPGPWAPAPPVQHPATTPAHGTAVQRPTPAHGTSAGPMPPTTAGAPVPAVPAQETPAAAAPVIPAQAAPPETTHAASPPPGIPTQPSPHPPVPATLDQPGPTATSTPTATSAQTPASTDTATQTSANPWQNYDPWALAAVPVSPLQQNGAAVASKEQRRKRAKKVLFAGALVLALVSGGVGGAVGAYLERNGGMGGIELPQAGAEPVGRAPDSVAGIAARALPSVVTLHVSGREAQGTGTGFVLDDRGHILTNNHVVEPAGDDGEISVTFHSGDTAKATVVGRDSGYDLAVVKVSGVSGLKPLPLGNSDNVQVGDPVVAIGAPFDLEGTVTSGIISAKERPITAGGESGDGSDVSYVDALQTDAPINPGNSGGPLLDARARVVGINSAIRSADTGTDVEGAQAGSIGLGFAIPVNQAKRVAEELINTGHATHPVIGVTLDMDYAGDGARVGTKGSDGGSAVTGGGPGDKAGIKPGDVITEVDGQRVHSGEELIVKTRAHRPGDRLRLTLKRGGKEVTISLTLGSSSGG
ncbi:trypsin-like peptidase domain-containing protein [Streptomyces chartreusis]|uniref:trypsin-like peptidase domain-containing protein n=1 Tax=Streptomyces chartreusis TaxID=1969 RepID=UPI002E808260|nr:trypsin-like peptidase domain-containing protein [Streptomyces chartreusis]WUB20469.1 trypsin-like peptidase domain-containing protein [Streptomyces chartreusis]